VFKMSNGVFESSDPNTPAVLGESTAFEGVRGVSSAAGNGGVVGINENHTPQAGPGVFGQSDASGVWGISTTWHGVAGQSQSTTGGAGVFGGSEVGPGVIGESKVWHAVYGKSQSTTGGAAVFGEHTSNGAGTVGFSPSGEGLRGVSESGEGVHAETKSPTQAAIAGYNLNPDGTGAAIYGKKEGQGYAGFFEGRVNVTGDLTAHDVFIAGGDCAEEFAIAPTSEIEPGMVMVLGQDAALHPSQQAYDKRVAGVISGAGDYKPGIVLDKQEASKHRMPVALVGKVHCKVDAHYASIEVGDLLTTSPTPGHAMKAVDPKKACGAVMGKALQPLAAGCGLIPILVTLQ
jgi:hypothetical protein